MIDYTIAEIPLDPIPTLDARDLKACTGVETFVLTRNNWVPNNPRLPVIVYHGVAAALDAGVVAYEEHVTRNGWIAQWRDIGIFTYHHWHTVHEVLGVVRGDAVFLLGGPGGRMVRLCRGDVLALPAGTAHFQHYASDDFVLVGAYTPDHPDWDDNTKAPTSEHRALMARLSAPTCDPVEGQEGPMVKLWSA